jgi:hypothetical protein
MGAHGKPRTTGRSAAIGALAVGASLTGVGLIAAAFDPAGPALTGSVLGGEAAGGFGAAMTLAPVADVVSVDRAAPVDDVGGAAGSVVDRTGARAVRPGRHAAPPTEGAPSSYAQAPDTQAPGTQDPYAQFPNVLDPITHTANLQIPDTRTPSLNAPIQNAQSLIDPSLSGSPLDALMSNQNSLTTTGERIVQSLSGLL